MDLKQLGIRALKNAQLDKRFTYRDLRHESIGRLFDKGLDPLIIMSISGHTEKQSSKRYLHPDMAQIRDKIDSYDDPAVIEIIDRFGDVNIFTKDDAKELESRRLLDDLELFSTADITKLFDE